MATSCISDLAPKEIGMNIYGARHVATFLAAAFFFAAATWVRADAVRDPKAAVMGLINAESKTDGKYHLSEKSSGKDLALTLKNLRSELGSSEGFEIVTGDFTAGGAPHMVEFFVDKSTGNVSAIKLDG